MKVLVIGSGGREHALVWKISQSQMVSETFCAPGNAGISDLANLVDIKADDVDGLLNFAREKKIDLTIVGPELSLTLGIVDLFEGAGLKIFGPSKKAAELEGSKAFTKNLLKKYNIPSANYELFTSSRSAGEYLKNQKFPIVIKADGLAAGKGVIICDSLESAEHAAEEILDKKKFGNAGNKIVVEEFLEGEEVSVLAFSDGKNIIPLEPAQDHKAIYDGNRGPNTGGMGAFSPAPIVTDTLAEEILENILKPTVNAMAQEGRTYKGILYAGLMIIQGEPKVLEFNVRFGDPETQPILMRMESDIVPLFLAAIEGSLDSQKIKWHKDASVCVVMASAGYPNSYPKGEEILGVDKLKNKSNTVVFHAGTKIIDSKLVTNGGRVLGVTSLGVNVSEAIKNSYRAVSKISWENVYYRRDIGKKVVE
ncbi:MAG TPA: phosphoribosylamine--glycine ligase [Nitrospinota bacterium]|nr:phosphoribosylamine--glycine ligase [Nitrospinota bacterium]